MLVTVKRMYMSDLGRTLPSAEWEWEWKWEWKWSFEADFHLSDTESFRDLFP